MKTEKILIIGPSGSGKDYLMRKLSEKGLKPQIKWTTRPPRKNEVKDKDYKFVSEEFFIESVKNGSLLFHQSFLVTPEGRPPEKWYYGISLEDFENCQIFILTPFEFSKISEEHRKKCFVVYLDIDRSVRENRLRSRDDKNDSIKRRLDSDDVDFKNFRDYDLKVNDSDFPIDDIYDLMC